MTTPAAADPIRHGESRRHFLRGIAAGSLGLAFFPALDFDPLEAAAPASPSPTTPNAPAPPPRDAPDERYWRQVKSLFPLRDGSIPMNAANLCPAPRSVIDAMISAMRDIESDVSFQNRAKYEARQEEVRARVAAFVGAAADEIALVRNTSEGNNVIAGGLPLGPGDEVLVFDENHPTNNVAWDVRAARHGFAVRRFGFDRPPAGPDQAFDAIRRALSPKTRVLAFSDVSNVTGTRLPVREICALARERGIHTHVDGAQTLGALRIDLHDLGCDSYAASAHKWLMGPKEAGILYVRADRIPGIWPGMVGLGWGRTAETEAVGARKFETVGQRNDATVAALGVAVEFHQTIGPARIEARVLELAATLKAGLAALPGLELVTPAAESASAGVVVARSGGWDAARVFESLYADHRIAGAPTGGLRLCPHVYNTLDDVERTVAAVATAIRTVG